MRRWSVLAVMGIVLAGAEREAAAQVFGEWIDRGYANVNVGFETGSGTLNDAGTFTIYGEPGTRAVQQAVDSGAFFDFSLGGRVWRNISVGLAFHRDGTSGQAAIQASVPNPVRFDAYRAVAATADDLDRSEQAVHIQFGYMLIINEELSVHVTAGPSIFRLRQEVVDEVAFTEGSFPFATVTANPAIEERTDTAVGVHLGVDAAYQIYDSDAYRIGAGVFLRWAGASASIPVLDSNVETDLGGVQVGLGARIRF